ncbi:hypothetical protein I3843_01G097800 [Carya illinoinensis]|uniref:Pirin-like protein n=1 Tax=Carya illinoinensis TaxID=32201 RepID=A0A922D4A8_CARIL|nr:hypothetical protein I3760_01G100300 [Carya illinoinensis]KAG6621618.1 hypothetical protein I3842_Q015900 [Carya illinoinensis]KAG7995228.1 hypothetical protein I3843_01G097800 [Carya illinoinensis]
MMLVRAISPKLLFHAKPAKTTPNHVRAPAFIQSIMSETGQAPSFETPRLVVKTVLATEQPEGDGAVVRRSIGRRELRSLDPFLLLDHFSVSPPGGFHDHPHRGFETVTYMFQGAITHQDFAGNKGTIQTGDVQWMTAGESMGVRSPVHTLTPTMYLDFTLKPGAELRQSIPESWNSFVYIIEGEGIFGSPNSAPVAAHNLLVLGPGDGLSVWNRSSNNLRFVLLGGQPLNEPMAKYGPFVMNTQAEINRTLEDFKHFKNGFELARTWRSQ